MQLDRTIRLSQYIFVKMTWSIRIIETSLQLKVININHIKKDLNKSGQFELQSKLQHLKVLIIYSMNTFSDRYLRVYSAKKWTFQHLFCIFVYFIIFALPFYFCFASKNFWFQQQYSKFTINYYYTGYYAAQVNYLNNSNFGTSQLAVIPSTTITDLTSLSLTVDDSSSASTFNFDLSSLVADQILSLNLIIYYDVQVPSLSRTVSAGFAMSIHGNIDSVSSSGKLSLHVQEPFNAITSSSSLTINRPAYFDQNFRSASSFSDLVNSHLSNPYKLQSQFFYQSVQDNSQISSSRKITVNLLKDTEIIIPYYPSILQTLKLKFSQYFGMLLLSYLIFHNMLIFLVKYQALECNERHEVPKSALVSQNGSVNQKNQRMNVSKF